MQDISLFNMHTYAYLLDEVGTGIIPLTQDQRDIGMTSDLSGHIPSLHDRPEGLPIA